MVHIVLTDKARLLGVACGTSSWIPAHLSPTPPSPSRPHICPTASPAELLYLEPHPHLFLPSSSSPSDLASVVISSGKYLLLFACVSASLLFCLLSPVLLAIILLWLSVNHLKKWERFGIVLVYAVHCISLRICDKVEHLLNEWREGQMEGGIERERWRKGWRDDAQMQLTFLREDIYSQLLMGQPVRCDPKSRWLFSIPNCPRLNPHGSPTLVLEGPKGRFHTLWALATRRCTLFIARGLLACTMPIPHSFITYFLDQTVNQPENA